MSVHEVATRSSASMPSLFRFGFVVVAAIALSACAGSSGSDVSSAPVDSSDATVTAASSASSEGRVRVAIVADSEIAPEVAQLIDDDDRIEVVSRELHDGFQIAQLDPFADAALAEDIDVLVYSGGANDLSRGPVSMLNDMVSRYGTYQASGHCIVAAVPIFRYTASDREQAENEAAGTRLLEARVSGTGVTLVSYLDISLDMLDEGIDFFAEGGLGAMHPGNDAHPRIATAIVDAASSCAAD